MAQVKKFQKGGGLYLDGKLLTDEQINAAMDTLSAEDKYTWSKSIDRARSGERVDLNELANSVTGGDFSHVLTERQLEKNTSGNLNRRQRNRHARKGTDIDSTNRGIANGISALKAQLGKPEEVTKTVLKRGSDSNGFYTKDKNGKYTYIDGPENWTNESVIRSVFDALENGNYKDFDLSGWDDADTLNGLTNWWANKGDFDRTAFFDRMRKNELDDRDWEILKAIGFDRSSVSNPTSTSTMDPEWVGNKDAATRAGVYFTKNSDETWNINGNNDYLNSTWYGGGLDFLTGTEFEGGGIHNGRLYTREQILNNDPSLQNVFGSWMTARDTAKDHRSWYDLANASGIRFVGDRISRGAGSDDYGIFNTQFNPNTHYNEYWSKYFKDLGLGNKTFDIADMSPAYTNLNGRQVLAYVDPNNTHDRMGIRSVKYVVRNTDGTYTQYDSEDALKAAGFVTNSDAYGFTPGEIRRDLWETIGNKRYHFAHDLVTFGDQNNVIMQGEDGKFYLARKNGDQHLNPRLIKNEKLLKQMLENPQNYKNVDIEQLTKQPMYVPEGTDKYEIARGFRRKNGGLIKSLPEKFQYGGNVGKTKTTTKDNSTEGKRTDITATHKTNGSDGGLTDAEKMQIAAAVGDLAGVGLSFGKGTTSWLGAGLGLGSTGLRLAADIKKDGFQGKDLWSAIAGAALDVASIVSTSASLGKAVQTLKTAAEPIMKVLALAGAANGVQAMGKVVRGEKVTSEDITAIISGLGSSMIAGKNLKDRIGKGKLSQQIESSVLKKQNADLDKEIGTTLKKKAKDVEKLITDANGSQQKVIDEVKKLLKAKTPDSEPTTADAKKVLEEWGVSFDGRSRFSGKSGEKWYQRINPFKKGEKQVNFTAPSEKEAHSLLRHMYDPRLRAQQLGYDAGYFGQKSGNLGTVTRRQVSDAIRAVQSGDAPLSLQKLAQQELVKLTARNPEAFGFSLNEEITNMNSGLGWPIMGRRVKYESPVSGVKYEGPTTKQLDLDNVPGIRVVDTRKTYKTPSVGKPKGSQSKFEKQLEAIKNARRMLLGQLDESVYANGRLPRFAQRIDDEIIGTDGVPMDYILRGNEFMPFRMLAFKQGGKIQFAKNGKKIVKAQPGLKVPMNPEDWKQYYVEPGSTFNDVILPETSAAPTTSTTTKSHVVPTTNRSYKINSGNNTFSLNTPTLEKPVAAVSPTSIEAKRFANQTFDYKTPTLPDYIETTEDAVDEPSLEQEIKDNFTGQAKRDALSNLKTAKSKASGTGNPYGEKTSGLNWGDIGNQLLQKGLSVGDLLSNLKGSKNQLELAKQMQVPLESKVVRKNPGFNDNGIALAYDQQIGRLNSVKGASSDYLTNFAIERSYKDNVFDLLKQKDLAMSQAYANWQNQNQQRIAQQDEQDRQIEFANNQRLAQKHNSILQAQGAHEAQVRQSMSNFSKQLQQDALQRQVKNDALKKMQFQSDYTTQFANPWQDKYKAAVTDGSKTFAQWLNDNPALRDRYQQERLEWQKKSVFKKGGKVRPASEKIWIDKQKSTAKAVERLSKQAYELLKMALS